MGRYGNAKKINETGETGDPNAEREANLKITKPPRGRAHPRKPPSVWRAGRRGGTRRLIGKWEGVGWRGIHRFKKRGGGPDGAISGGWAFWERGRLLPLSP